MTSLSCATLRIATCLLLPVLLLVAAAADREPDWLRTARQAPVTVPVKDAPAVVLLDEILLEVAADGTITTRKRYAVRVLTGEGSKRAQALVQYNTDAMKVKSLQAWLISGEGTVTAFGKRRMVDAAVHANALELYGEVRMQLISAKEEAKPGAVFGYESVLEQASTQFQHVARFHSTLPVERVAFSVKLPAGWQLVAHPFNGAPAYTAGANGRYDWTQRAMPALVKEPLAPPTSSFSPWVAIDFVPPAAAKKKGTHVALNSWSAISAHFSPAYEAAAVPDAAMKAKADELVRGRASLFSRLQALADHVQQVNYISILLDASNAGGMIPRASTRVFRTNDGDCKDKATLLRALLATQGVASYPLIVQSGNTTQLREDWPSPLQFNHVILAIQVDDTVESSAVLIHPELGRLLLFDPTNEFTPIGYLVDTIMAERGLLFAGSRGGLVTLPKELPESNRRERRVHATLDELGGVAGTVEEELFGHASASARAERRRKGETEFRQGIARWLAKTLPAARNARVETTDSWTENRFKMTTDFASDKYGKLMRDELLVFKPILVARREIVALRKGSRTQPILLRPARYSERTEITLPAGWAVEESIQPVNLTTPFGSYQAVCTPGDGKLVFVRSLDLRAAELPISEYEAVRGFFERIDQTEGTSVVLRRSRAVPKAP